MIVIKDGQMVVNMADRKQKSQQDERRPVQITKVDAWSTVKEAAEQLKNLGMLSDNNKAIFFSDKENYKPVQMVLTFLGNQGLLGKDWTPNMQSKEQIVRLQNFLISLRYTVEYPKVQAVGETTATEKPGFFNQSTADALLRFATRMEALEKTYGKKKLNETVSYYCKKNGTENIADFLIYIETNAETLKNKDAKKILAEFEKSKEPVEEKPNESPVITRVQENALIDAVLEDVREEKKQQEEEEKKLAGEREKQEREMKKTEEAAQKAKEAENARLAEEQQRKAREAAEAGLPTPIQAKQLRDDALRKAQEMRDSKLEDRVKAAKRENIRGIAEEVDAAYVEFKEKQAKKEGEKPAPGEKAVPADEIAVEARIRQTRERIEAMKRSGLYNNDQLDVTMAKKDYEDMFARAQKETKTKQRERMLSEIDTGLDAINEYLTDLEQGKKNADALMARITPEKLKELDELPDSPGKEIVKKEIAFIKKKYNEKEYGILNNPYHVSNVEFFENVIDLWRATKELKQKYESTKANPEEWARLDDDSKTNLPKTIELVDKEWKLFGRGVALWHAYNEARSDRERTRIEQEWAQLRPEERKLPDGSESKLRTISKVADPNRQPPVFCTSFIGLGLDTCKFCLKPKPVAGPVIEPRKISRPLPMLRAEEPDTRFRTKELSNGEKIDVMVGETVVMERIPGKSDEVTLSYSTENKLIMTYLWFSYTRTKLDDGRVVYLIVDPDLESANKYIAYVDREGNVFKIDTAKMTPDSLKMPVVLDESGEPKVFARIDVDNENEKLGFNTTENFGDAAWFVRNCCMKVPDNRPVQFKKAKQSAGGEQKAGIEIHYDYTPEYKNE